MRSKRSSVHGRNAPIDFSCLPQKHRTSRVEYCLRELSQQNITDMALITAINNKRAKDRPRSFDASAGAFVQHPYKCLPYRRYHGKQSTPPKDVMSESANE